MTTGLVAPTPTDELQFVIEQSRLDDADRHEAELLRGQIVTLTGRARELAASGELTDAGLIKALEPHRAPVLRAIGAYEARTQAEQERLDVTKGAIERGELVRNEAGEFTPVMRTEPTMIDMARYAFLWTQMLDMDRRAVRDLVLRADESGDFELLDAVRLAPRSFPVVDDVTLREVADRRWRRSGWQNDYAAGLDRIVGRQQVARKARQALGVSVD